MKLGDSMDWMFASIMCACFVAVGLMVARGIEIYPPLGGFAGLALGCGLSWFFFKAKLETLQVLGWVVAAVMASIGMLLLFGSFFA